MFLCVRRGCWCQGSPLGRGRAVIARSSPGAGYGHPGHVSWVTAKPHGGFPHSVSYSSLPALTYIPPTHTQVMLASFQLLSPLTLSFFCISLFTNVLSALVSLSFPFSRVVSTSVSFSLHLSILARLYFFISRAVGGGSAGLPGDVRVH